MKLTPVTRKATRIATSTAAGLGTLLAGASQAFAQLGSQPVPSAARGTTSGDLATDVGTVINFFLGFTALVAVILIIYGGFLFITSAGEEDKAAKGKKILIYAVIGIIIVILAYTIVNTVIQNLAGG